MTSIAKRFIKDFIAPSLICLFFSRAPTARLTFTCALHPSDATGSLASRSFLWGYFGRLMKFSWRWKVVKTRTSADWFTFSSSSLDFSFSETFFLFNALHIPILWHIKCVVFIVFKLYCLICAVLSSLLTRSAGRFFYILIKHASRAHLLIYRERFYFRFFFGAGCAKRP